MKNYIINVNDILFEKEVLNYLGYVLVIFHSKLCGPCKLFFSSLKEVYNDYINKFKFIKVDINKSNLLISKYNINSVPTIILFNKGKIISKKIGIINRYELIKFLDLYL